MHLNFDKLRWIAVFSRYESGDTPNASPPDISAPQSFQCPVRTVLPDWFCQKLIKNAKIPSKIVKIWLFLWNPNLVALKPQLPETGSWGFSATRYGFHKIAKSWLFYWGFWHFWLIFGKTNLVILNPQLPVSGSWGFSATRYGFHKKAKSWLFYWGFWHFWEIFGKTTSGNTVRTGHQNNWDSLMSGFHYVR